MFVQAENFGSANEFRCRVHHESYNFRSHIHQFAEIMLVLEGKIEVTLDGKTETAEAGQFILIFPLQTHAFHTPKHSKVWNCVFTPSLTSEFFAAYGNAVGEHAVFRGGDFALDCFHRLLVTGKDLRFFSVKACLYAALSDFVTQVKPVKREKDTRLSGLLVAWLMEHATQPVTLADAAKALGYAENYLSHKISKLFGMNFRNLVGCLRAERAKELLSATDKTVLQIAYECGFENERSFTRSFKRVTEQTPGEYRRNTEARIMFADAAPVWRGRWQDTVDTGDHSHTPTREDLPQT